MRLGLQERQSSEDRDRSRGRWTQMMLSRNSEPHWSSVASSASLVRPNPYPQPSQVCCPARILPCWALCLHFRAKLQP